MPDRHWKFGAITARRIDDGTQIAWCLYRNRWVTCLRGVARDGVRTLAVSRITLTSAEMRAYSTLWADARKWMRSGEIVVKGERK